MLALLRGNEDGWGSTLIVAELAGAAVALIAFVVVELRVREPMLPMRMFRDATFTGAQVAAFAISASFFAIFLYATLYLQQILGLSAIEAGLVYLPGTILMLVVSGATAQLGAKVPAAHDGRRRPRARGRRHGPVHARRRDLVVVDGHARACWSPASAPASSTRRSPHVALGAVPVEQSGLAAGVNDTARQAGIAVGVAALGALIPAEAALSGGSAGRRTWPACTTRSTSAPCWPRRAPWPRRSSSPSASAPAERESLPGRRGPRGRPEPHVTSLAISSAIASEAVAAGDGALSTWTARPVRASLKSSTSVPSRPTAWARTPAGPALDVARPELGDEARGLAHEQPAADRVARSRSGRCATSGA